MASNARKRKPIWKTFPWIVIGALIAAASIRFIILPNNVIDGGVTGISMILAHIIGKSWLPTFSTTPKYSLHYICVQKFR